MSRASWAPPPGRPRRPPRLRPARRPRRRLRLRPPAQTTPTTPPAQPATGTGDAGETDQPKTKDKPAKDKTPTRLGHKQVEHSAPAKDRTKAKTPATPAPGPNTTASNGSAGLPALTFTPPSAAAPVPDVLLDRFPIPPFLLPIYQAAAVQYDVPWQILAAINEIETDYGRDLNVSSAGALGWMQFMPSSWQAYGVDANDDGKKDPYNPVDAIFASARYLKAAGAGDDIRQAIFAYNHADWYVESVMLRAKLIRQMPLDLVGALTGLTEGRFPVAARATYPKTGGGPKGVEIDAREKSPVIAINDGVVRGIGFSRKLGHYLRLKDFYGNTYTYAQLGSVRDRYATPRSLALAELQGKTETEKHAASKDPKPKAPASAGRQVAHPSGASPETITIKVAKERLFAHPARPAAYDNGGQRQLAEVVQALPADQEVTQYLTADYPLHRRDLVLRPLRKGSAGHGRRDPRRHRPPAAEAARAPRRPRRSLCQPAPDPRQLAPARADLDLQGQGPARPRLQEPLDRPAHADEQGGARPPRAGRQAHPHLRVRPQGRRHRRDRPPRPRHARVPRLVGI